LTSTKRDYSELKLKPIESRKTKCPEKIVNPQHIKDIVDRFKNMNCNFNQRTLTLK